MKILVTGAAGFIGFYVTRLLAGHGHEVVGLDNINDYYNTELKYARLREMGIEASNVGYGSFLRSSLYPNYRFVKMDIQDRDGINKLFITEKFDKVCNLAAQAGVRYSIENPYAYIESNVIGFLNILEACRRNKVSHLVYASSSSVYGGNEKVPFSEDDRVDNPVSIYAATKKSNELMANVYSKLYGIAATGLRYFTVYGPWGRPDMAPMLFAGAITGGRPIKVFNNGDLSRDFTYIDDIAEGTVRVLEQEMKCTSSAVIYNIGCSHPVKLMDFINEMESALGRKAVKEMVPMQDGDVFQTYADTSKLEMDFGYRPVTSLHDGMAAFVEWYKKYESLNA